MTDDAALGRSQLSTFVSTNTQRFMRFLTSAIYPVGTVAPRRGDAHGNEELQVRVDRTAAGTGRLTLKAALFPYIFPRVLHRQVQREPEGVPQTSDDAPFHALHPREAVRARSVPDMPRFGHRQLHQRVDVDGKQDIERFLAMHPDTTPGDALRNVIKCKVPRRVSGSPQYFRRKLVDLLATRHKFGIPRFFITLAADAFTDTRWRWTTTSREFCNSSTAAARGRTTPSRATGSSKKRSIGSRRRSRRVTSSLVCCITPSGSKCSTGALPTPTSFSGWTNETSTGPRALSFPSFSSPSHDLCRLKTA